MSYRWQWVVYGLCWLALIGGSSLSRAGVKTGEELYFLGIKAYQDGLWDLAVQQLDKYLSLYPEGSAASRARFIQAEALFQKRQYRQAAAVYQRFSQLHPDSKLLDKVWYRLGVCNYRLGDYQAAETAYRQLLAGFPLSPLGDKARLGLAEALYAQAEYKSAKQNYQQIVQQSPPHPNLDLALYGLGWSCLKLGDYNQAVASFSRLIADFPLSPVYSEAAPPLAQAYYGQGESWYEQGQYQLALESYRRLLRDYPESELAPGATYKLGLCHLELNQPDKGVASFKRLIAEYPEHQLVPAAWLRLGELRFERKDYAAAARAYTNAARSPDQRLAAEARYWLGECLAHQGRLEQALAEFLKLLRQYPAETHWLNLARYQAGQIYLRQQKEPAAKKLFLQVAQESTNPHLVQLAKKKLQELLTDSGSE
jgi:TolA-binding protein